jgi:hypothetical protein
MGLILGHCVKARLWNGRVVMSSGAYDSQSTPDLHFSHSVPHPENSNATEPSFLLDIDCNS